MEPTTNATGQQPEFLLVFGFLLLPKDHEVELDIVVSVIGLMSLIGVIANTILLLVIIKDPFKQLRTITATLLAFNSAANLSISLLLLLDAAFFWSHRKFSPKLVVYLSACSASLYFIGNLLHTLNIFGTVVLPIRYAFLEPKVRKNLVWFLISIWIVVICVIIIPPYALPESKVPTYVKGLLTFVCVQLAILTLAFIYLYTKIFQALNARKQRLVVSFQIKHSTPQGMKIMKKNYEVAKTLFIHVLFFVIATAPGNIIMMVFLHCKTSCDPTALKLSSLFSMPCMYTTFVFLPILWLSRLNSYRKAMKQTLSFRRPQTKDSDNGNSTIDERKQRSDTVSTVTSF